MLLEKIYNKIPQKFRILFPSSICKKIIEYYYIRGISKKQEKALQSLKEKKVIKCVFFALFDSVWKYDKVYNLMAIHPRFDPVILVCPIINFGRENMKKRMNDAYDYFVNKGYNVIKSYNEQKDSYIDIRKDIIPDIIFYTNPYKGLIDYRYFITNYQDLLTVYVPYSINNTNAYEVNYNIILHNLVWRHYLPTQYHLNYSKKYARNKGVNSFTTGYPGIEPLIDNHAPLNSAWKITDNRVMKKIIWAPHHTVEKNGVLYYSCFLRYHDFMIKLAQKYQDKVQFVFKPHPLLKNKLYNMWGKNKTEDYYNKWLLMANTNISEGSYEDLFLTSDAMIHDCGSFIGEYLYVNKPVMRTLNNVPESEKMNDFAMKCISNHYLAYNEQDIEQFIQNVINDIDPLKEQRTKFVNEELMPKGSPSQNIVDDILNSIDNQVLYRQ